MSTINDRVKELRTTLGLSGEKFGERIGLKRAAISRIENNLVGLNESNILLICREFHVNEDWLRNGNSEMFVPHDSITLDEVIKTQTTDPIEVELIRAYFSLDKDLRAKVIEHIKSNLIK